MKKLIALLLAALLLAACAPASVPAPPEATAQGRDNAGTPPSAVTPSPAPIQAENALAVRRPETVGTWDGDAYTNEWLGLNFKLPDGYQALSPQETRVALGLETLEDIEFVEYCMNTDYYVVGNEKYVYSHVIISDMQAMHSVRPNYDANDLEFQFKADTFALFDSQVNNMSEGQNPATLVESYAVTIGSREYMFGKFEHQMGNYSYYFIHADDEFFVTIFVGAFEGSDDDAMAFIETLKPIKTP